MTIPAVLVAAMLLTIVFPLLLLVTLVADLLTGPRRWRWTRVLGMTINYAWLETFAIACASAFWIIAGFGTRVRSKASLRRHHRLQAWWIGKMFAAAEFWFGLRLDIEGMEHLEGGNLIVLGRHACLPDALLPAQVFAGLLDRPLRMVLKSDLAWVPSLDLFGNRLPNHFVDRSSRGPEAEREAVAALGRGVTGEDALAIFPEGTYRSPGSWKRALERVDRADPRFEQRSQLRHLLPARPGGALALMSGAPDADVVMMNHVGFDGLWNMAQVMRTLPFRRPVKIRLQRIDRSTIPTGDNERIAWLDDRWSEMDQWIHEQLAGR